MHHKYVPLLVLTRENCYRYRQQWWKNTEKLKLLLKDYGINYQNVEIVFVDDRINRIKNNRKNINLIEIKPYYTDMVNYKYNFRKVCGDNYRDNDRELQKLLKII